MIRHATIFPKNILEPKLDLAIRLLCHVINIQFNLSPGLFSWSALQLWIHVDDKCDSEVKAVVTRANVFSLV